MKRSVFTIVVSLLAAASAPAFAADDLPMTSAFAGALASYRDCVIGAVDRSGVAEPDAMAAAALAACGAAHDVARRQLATDIIAVRPHAATVAAQQAQSGMATIEPMIAAIALNHAREMVGEAATEAPVLAPTGNIG
ncbi:hypothetical protein BH10PSE13_BH10PSE13_14830 [soil metagenome]